MLLMYLIFNCSDISYKNKEQNVVRLIDFSVLLKHFIEVQEKHKEYKRISRIKEISLTDYEPVGSDAS